ncbi:MAG: hypothetical protein IJ489_09455 [Clostridia bacterium]|nr:hypothetical protein [Clostridia bacterium]
MLFGKRKKDEWNIQDFIARINQYISTLELYQRNWLTESRVTKDSKAANAYQSSAEKAKVYISVLRGQVNILNHIMPPRNQQKRNDLMKQLHSTLKLLEGTADIFLPVASMREAEPYVNDLQDLIDQMTCT